MRRTYLAISVAIFASLLVTAWVTNDTGIKINDPKNNIFIPTKLMTTLQVKASHNDEN